MSLIGSDIIGTNAFAALTQAEGDMPPHVLLVTDDQQWISAVREAVAEDGGILETLPPGAAITRVAGMGPTLSHVLVDPTGINGLLSALVDLTSDIASPGAALVLLGARSPIVGPTVLTPGREAIAACLATRSAPPEHAEPGLEAADLREVIDGQMIETRYQPIVRIADRAVTSMEVLARLKHPRHGPLAPDWFVARFEDAGLSTVLTDLVSNLALNDLAGPAFGGLSLALALNYPLRVLTHPGAAADLDRLRAAMGLTPAQIHLELTESRPVDDFPALARALEQLRTLGYHVSIDDVSPEIPNLDRLLTMPFSAAKLDKTAVQTIGRHGSGGDFAARIVDKALARGLRVVAEGIETETSWNDVQRLGVQEAQGFFIARPLPAAAVRIWVENWRLIPL